METITFDITNIGWVLSLVLGAVLYNFSMKMKLDAIRREMQDANRGINSYMDESLADIRRQVYNIEKDMGKSETPSKNYYNSGV